MGSGLSGGIPYQPNLLTLCPGGANGGCGQATQTQWRTAPLWGLSTRLLLGLLHNNKEVCASSTDLSCLDRAIRDHGGEASQVVGLYEALDPTDNSNLLAFLSSL